MSAFRNTLRVTALTLPLATAHIGLAAEHYPARRVTVIAPFPAGASADAAARIVLQRMTELLGQPFIVENRKGALGEIGVREMLKASADGYTLCFCNDGGAITVPAAYAAAGKTPPYSPDDFTAIGQAVEIYFVLVVRNELPVKNFSELVAYIRANPGKLNVASGSPMGTIFTGLLKHALGNDVFTEIPYSGDEPKAMIDLVGDRIDVMASTSNTSLPHIESGSIRAIGTIGTARNPFLPAVLTLDEQVPEMREFHDLVAQLKPWNGLLGPKGLPEHVVQTLSAALQRTLTDPEVIASLQKARLGVRFGDAKAMNDLFSRLPTLIEVMKRSGATIIQ